MFESGAQSIVPLGTMSYRGLAAFREKATHTKQNKLYMWSDNIYMVPTSKNYQRVYSKKSPSHSCPKPHISFLLPLSNCNEWLLACISRNINPIRTYTPMLFSIVCFAFSFSFLYKREQIIHCPASCLFIYLAVYSGNICTSVCRELIFFIAD